MSSTKKILVTGANGQLGMEFRDLEHSFPHHRFTFVSRAELPIEDLGAVKEYFANNNFDYCINCAAYTAVDKAQTEKTTAMEVNSIAVGNLARVTAEQHCRFIHFSTDYVFSGKALQPYQVDDMTEPVNFYGQTKLEGEKAAISVNPDALIIRTSWVYSRHGKNFVKTMLRLLDEKTSINVVNDQLGSPTYAADLAGAVMQIIEGQAWVPGVYHYSNAGIISWFDFASKIAEFIQSKCVVNAIPSTEFPTPAARPSFSAFDNSRITENFGVHLKPWEESLRRMLNK